MLTDAPEHRIYPIKNESQFRTRDFGAGVEVTGKRLLATLYEQEHETHFRLTTEGLNVVHVAEQGGSFITLSIREPSASSGEPEVSNRLSSHPE